MTCELNLSNLKHNFAVREFGEKKIQDKKKIVLLLIKQFLKEEGYYETLKQFENESKLNDNQYTICDNIDLLTILHEYEAYYLVRFQKYPKLFKKEGKLNEMPSRKINLANGDINAKKIKKNDLSDKPNNSCLDEEATINSSLSVKSLISVEENQNSSPEFKLMKPLGLFDGYNEDWKNLANVISKEIIEKKLNVTWNSIIGLESAKILLKESIIYPIKYPDLFQGILTPWKGLLLYGPSGTGKTLLAKAVATECNTTFFNISASSVVSKWRGDSEKLIRVMFDMARLHAPSTIFIDELDALASCRGINSEHEASRRLKSEFLVQLDGLIDSNDKVFLLTASNLPWELDPAVLRRLEKRILIDIPNINSRKEMIVKNLPPIILTKPNLSTNINSDIIAEKTEGYSGSDIKLVCKEAAMKLMRKVFQALETKDEKIKVNLTITTDDVLKAIAKTKPTSTKLLEKYRCWQEEFGSF